MITVQESLRLPELQEIIDRSGQGGLARKIRWVHVIDHKDVAHFLEGQELLLSCGQVWPEDRKSEEKFLNSLLRHQISGIILATGRYLSHCPPALLEFGEKYSIPIMEASFQVPFVRVTRAIHQEIMERQFKTRELVNPVPTSLTELLQVAKDGKEVCEILASFLKCTVVITDETNAILIEAGPKNEQRNDFTQKMKSFAEQLKNEHPYGDRELSVTERNIEAIHLQTVSPYVMAVPVFIEGNEYGTLWLLHNDNILDEYHTLALEHSAHVLIDLYRLQQEENVKRWQLQSEVLGLLIENLETACIVIDRKMHEIGLKTTGKWMAGLILSGNVKLAAQTLLELGLIRGVCNKWFKKQGEISGFCEIYNNQVVLLFSSGLENAELDKRLAILSQQIANINDQLSPVIVIGDAQTELISYGSSYKSAKSLAAIVQYKTNSGQIFFTGQFRREILLYGNMSPVEAHNLLNKLLPEELRFEKDEVLYETLTCLALNSFNRETVAKTLHIHRNTLRYRIKKIEELLQDSLSSPDCQFWIQTALNIESLSRQYRST
jgi:purine catabolism regulator